jgi:hypothetical protein
METKMVEYNELIANRVKGQGDTWVLVDDKTETIHTSLTDTLEAWFSKNQEQAEFRLSPLSSKLYVIRSEEKIIEPEPIKRYNIYGDAI